MSGLLWRPGIPVTDPTTAPLNLKGWHAAFLAVGIPGIFMALWVRSLREPKRALLKAGRRRTSQPIGWLRTELAAMTPILNLYGLPEGASIRDNLLADLFITIVAWGLIELTGNVPQWVALGIGVYVVYSWVQSLCGIQSPTT